MIDWLRIYCLTLPYTTEHIPWGEHLVYKVGGKMYAASALSPEGHRMSFKCTPEDFGELTEQPGIVPAPYSARMHWIALETEDALPRAEIRRLVKLSYDLVFARLPKKTQASFLAPPQPKTQNSKRIKSKR